MLHSIMSVGVKGSILALSATVKAFLIAPCGRVVESGDGPEEL